MKYVRVLGLLALAVTALMAFVATASATTVTSPTTGTPLAKGAEIHAVSEGHVELHNPIVTIKCNSTVKGRIEVNGITGTKASGPVETLIFGTKATEGCTDEWVVHVNNPGSLSVEHFAGTENGILFSSGATVTATRFGLECRYKTETTEIGTLTSSGLAPSEKTATLDIKAAIPRHGGSFLCGTSAANWTGNYQVQTPDRLWVSH